MLSYSLDSLEETQKLAHFLAQQLPSNSLLLLTGPLGAGKTTLTQALVKELASPAQANSPTYTLIHEYPSPEGIIVHMDAYRLERAEALLELGLEDYLDYARLVIVEWGEDLKKLFPDALQVKLEFSESGRLAHIVGLSESVGTMYTTVTLE